MSETQTASAPRRGSSDFSIERILSESASPCRSGSAKVLPPEPLQTSSRFLTAGSADTHPSSSFVAQNKLDWLRNFCKMQSPNSRLRLTTDVTESNQLDDKSTDAIDQFDHLAEGNSEELSWLRCTRYHPPKLPRKSSSGKILKRKPGSNPRIPFTKYQLEILENRYKKSVYLTRKDVVQISNILHLPQTRIKIWFQNRRARERRESESFGRLK